MDENAIQTLQRRVSALEQELDEMTTALAHAWDQLVPFLKETLPPPSEARSAPAQAQEDIYLILESILASTEMDSAAMYSSDTHEWFVLPAGTRLPLELQDRMKTYSDQGDVIYYEQEEDDRWVFVPLIAEQGVAGMVGIGSRTPEHDFTSLQVRILKRLTERLASQIIAARLAHSREKEARLGHELEIASNIQRSLQPHNLPALGRLQLAAEWQPARLVGGDAWGWALPPNGAFSCFLLDMAGKGLPAALAAMSLHTAIQLGLRTGLSPVEVVRTVSEQVYDTYTATDLLATVTVLSIDPQTGVLEQANAGHVPTLIRHGGAWVELKASVPPIGVFPDMLPDLQSFTLAPGDLVVCYTDGYTELSTQDGMWGIEGLIGAIPPDCEDVQLIASGIAAAARRIASDASLRDDQTLLVIRYG